MVIRLNRLFVIVSLIAILFAVIHYGYEYYRYVDVIYVLKIDSLPQGTEVWCDNVKLGNTPFNMQLPDDIAKSLHYGRNANDCMSSRIAGGNFILSHGASSWTREFEFRRGTMAYPLEDSSGIALQLPTDATLELYQPKLAEGYRLFVQFKSKKK